MYNNKYWLRSKNDAAGHMPYSATQINAWSLFPHNNNKKLKYFIPALKYFLFIALEQRSQNYLAQISNRRKWGVNTSTISLLSSRKIKFLQKPTSAYGALILNPVLLLPIQISLCELPPIRSQVFVFHSEPEENRVATKILRRFLEGSVEDLL